MPEEAAPPQTYRDLAGLQLSNNSPVRLPRSAQQNIFLARRTNPAGRERELAKLSSCSRSSASKTNTAFGRPIAIATSIVHGRCPYSQQY
jgi:hypothetical protein